MRNVRRLAFSDPGDVGVFGTLRLRPVVSKLRKLPPSLELLRTSRRTGRRFLESDWRIGPCVRTMVRRLQWAVMKRSNKAASLQFLVAVLAFALVTLPWFVPLLYSP
jgi:hypothetical protein